MISRSRFPEDFEGLLQSVSTKRQARKRRRIMIKVVWVHQLIHRVQIALVDLFVKPTYKSLVGFGRHGRFLLPVNWFPTAEHTPAFRANTPQNEILTIVSA